MKTNPVLSIIVPIYKVEPYLRECVDSILAQTFQDYEMILVDDGSPDRCGEICEEYTGRYPDKIKVVHKVNGGLSSARNAGMDIATGEFIGYVDSDDVILPEMYENLVDAMRKHQADMVFSQVLYWDGNKKTNKNLSEEIICTGEEAYLRMLGWQESVSVWSKLFRREKIAKLRFREGLTNEDFPFVSELLMDCAKVVILPDGYYRYRITPGSITNVMRPNFFDIFDNLEHVEKLLKAKNSYSKAITRAFRRYCLTMHIMSGVKIVKTRQNGTYKKWLRKNRKFILKNWKMMLTDRHLSARWRVKGVAAFLRLYF